VGDEDRVKPAQILESRDRYPPPDVEDAPVQERVGDQAQSGERNEDGGVPNVGDLDAGAGH
jgi:hypothetical protein